MAVKAEEGPCRCARRLYSALREERAGEVAHLETLAASMCSTGMLSSFEYRV